MAKLVIIRGLPGSGKSTLARTFEGFVHLEADMFFMTDGEYVFNPANVTAAHAWCQIEMVKALEAGRDFVVSNTFVRRWEIRSYTNLAPIGTEISEVTATGSYANVHGVPEAVVERMRQNWEE